MCLMQRFRQQPSRLCILTSINMRNLDSLTYRLMTLLEITNSDMYTEQQIARMYLPCVPYLAGGNPKEQTNTEIRPKTTKPQRRQHHLSSRFRPFQPFQVIILLPPSPPPNPSYRGISINTIYYR